MASVIHGTLEALRVLHTVPTKSSPSVHTALVEAGEPDIERQLFSYWQLEAALSAALLSSGGAGTVSALGERLQMQHTVFTQRLYRTVFASPKLQTVLEAASASTRGDDGAGIVQLAEYVKELVRLRSGDASTVSATTSAAAVQPVASLSAEALTAIQLRQQQHDTDIELLSAEVSCAGRKSCVPLRPCRVHESQLSASSASLALFATAACGDPGDREERAGRAGLGNNKTKQRYASHHLPALSAPLQSLDCRGPSHIPSTSLSRCLATLLACPV